MTQNLGRRGRGTLGEATGPSKRQRRKFIACQRCHAHKIKCSGGHPCTKCQQVGCVDECRYEPRDRQVKMSESYLERILSENKRLKEHSGASANSTEPPRPATATEETTTSSSSAQNPLIGDRAWFHPYDPSAPPIFIGEAACTAFATRFRRFLTGSNATAHIPRTQYVKEANIAAANGVNVQWPSRQRARLLAKIALHQIGCIYHLVLRKSTLEKLEDIYQTRDFDCTVNQCKYFALFAFGEAYSLRAEPSSGCRVPGTSYFARALSLVQVLPERTSITHLETLLLLSLFSYYLNRRHSAYVLIGSAMRLSLCIGLNHNIPESQLIDPVERQHRVRIWWTIYVFDRMWASKMGLPSQILDDDIHVDMPSTIHPSQLHDEQFSNTDTEYLTANVKLARIVGETIAKLYSRRKYGETFLQRVQGLLKALKGWVEGLPGHIRLNQEDPEANRKPITSLHLAFNQCVILTTRPMLLHLLIKLSETDPMTPNPPNVTNTNTSQIPQPVLTLSEACIHAARHSHSLILTKYLNSTLPVFGYFHAHYLFSSALVLAMSSFVPLSLGINSSPMDINGFETALEVLRAMSENGNLAGAEFFLNLEQVRVCLDAYQRQKRGGCVRNGPDGHGGSGNARAAIGPGDVSAAIMPVSVPTPVEGQPSNMAMNEGEGGRGDNSPTPDTNLPQSLSTVDASNEVGGFTAAMAFLEPTMQDFLAQSDVDLGLLNPVDTFLNDAESLYTCHGL